MAGLGSEYGEDVSVMGVSELDDSGERHNIATLDRARATEIAEWNRVAREEADEEASGSTEADEEASGSTPRPKKVSFHDCEFTTSMIVHHP
jgi:hypothetical protein